MIKTAVVYAAAAFFEIAGCFSFWIWVREGKTGWWLAPDIISLALFAGLLTQVEPSPGIQIGTRSRRAADPSASARSSELRLTAPFDDHRTVE